MQQFPHIRHDQCLVLLYHFHQKIMQKKLEIFKKCSFLGQSLDFLTHSKPGLYILHLDFFFFSSSQRKKHCDLHRCEKNIELKENTSLPNVICDGVQFRTTNYLNKIRREIS